MLSDQPSLAGAQSGLSGMLYLKTFLSKVLPPAAVQGPGDPGQGSEGVGVVASPSWTSRMVGQDRGGGGGLGGRGRGRGSGGAMKGQNQEREGETEVCRRHQQEAGRMVPQFEENPFARIRSGTMQKNF
eukprot:756272-Hanusia_phi.AAC.6